MVDFTYSCGCYCYTCVMNVFPPTKNQSTTNGIDDHTTTLVNPRASSRTGEDALGFGLGLPLKAKARAHSDRPSTSCLITPDSKRKALMCYSMSYRPRSSRCYHPQLDAMSCVRACQSVKSARMPQQVPRDRTHNVLHLHNHEWCQ